MRNLVSIVNKNMKVIYRSKISFLLMLLSPILIVFLVGSAFSSDSLNEVYLGVYSSEYSDLTNNITSSLGEKDFIILTYESIEECIGSVKNGASHACVIFPANLSIEGNEELVEIYVDSSRVNLAYNLINSIKSKISIEGTKIGVAMADELLDNLNLAKNSLPNTKSKIDLAKSNLEVIKSESNELKSSSSTADSISELDEAINSINAINTEDDLSEIISQIESIKSSLNSSGKSFDGGLDSINSEGEKAKTNIESAREEIQSLIDELSSSSINNSENVVNPIKTEIKEINSEHSNWNNLFPTLIALILLLSSIVLSSSLVLSERKSRANFRNFMTPTTDFTFLIGTYITSMIILLIQMIILFLGAYYLTKINAFSLEILAIFFLSSSVFILLGMFIGYLFKSDETTILASISVASILIFFSNLIIPSELIGGTMRIVSDLNPLLITDSLLRRVILFSEPINFLGVEILILGCGILLLLILTAISREIVKRCI